jgi:hypothetical protein
VQRLKDNAATLLAALTSLVLAAIVTWPVALRPTTLLVGHPGNDSWNHVWGYWWVGAELSAGRWPIHTELLSYPDGGTLYFIDTVQAVVSWPLQWIGGPALAFNAVILAELALSGFAAWLLARRLTGDALASGAALVVYGAAPHLLGQAYNGISETVCAGWFPLTLLCVLRVLERASVGRAVVLALCAAACVLTSWYFGLFAALGSLLLIGWQATQRSWSIQWGRTLAALVGAGTGALALILPVFSSFSSSLDAPDALVKRDPAFVEASLINHNITDILAFFRLSRTASPDLRTLYGEELIIVIYLGWVALLIAGYELWATRRRRELGAWLMLGGVFFLFSLGPWLNVGGEYVELLGRQVPLPFLPLYKALPIFDRISHPFRFVMGVQLALAMLAAHGLRHLLRRRAQPVRIGLALALGTLALVEIATTTPARLPVPSSDATIPALYDDLAADPTPGAVLDLPMTVPNLERAVYVWYQSAHGRPVPWGLNEPMPRLLLENRLTVTLIRLEATRAQTLPPRLPELDMVVAARSLARQGYRYIVVHESLYPAFKLDQVEALLTGAIGEPARRDGRLVYTLTDPTLASR